MKVIVAATPANGHLAPLRTIAADLASRGFDVTFVTASAGLSGNLDGVREVALNAGADFDLDVRTHEERESPDAPPPGPEQLNRDLQWGFIAPMSDQHATLQRLLGEAGAEPVTVIVDNGFQGAWPMLLGAPGLIAAKTIVIGVTPLTATSVDLGPFGLGLPPDSSEEGRARNAQLNAQIQGLLAPAQTSLDEVLAALGARPAPYLLDASTTLPDTYLQLAPTAVEYPRSDLPDAVHFIGPLPSAPGGEDTLPEWWSELEAARRDGRRVIAVTQGTANNGDLSMLVGPTLAAVGDRSDLFVLAVTGRDDHGLEDPPNGRVAGFVPFSFLLRQLDLLVTNGGWGGSLAALAAGVPLIAAGDTEDKAETSARFAWAGAGINLATGRPSVEAIAVAVTSMLGDPAYANRAREIAAAIAELDPLTSVAEAIGDGGVS